MLLEDARQPALSAHAFTELLAEHMPQVGKAGLTVEEMGFGTCRIRLPVGADDLRAGGTISGPTMFSMADLALYGAVLSRIGPVALAVTSTMTITFLRKPGVKPLVAEGRVIRMGRRLAYGEISLFSDGEEEPVAHATGSYAIPSGAAGG